MQYTSPNIGNSNKGAGKQQNASQAIPKEKPSESNAIKIPQISLPKGGGALKGIDEKFEVNAANGTASFSIPLPITPGRNNFSPSLSISYNSGAGNSPFGLGWNLSLPSIQRKTDKALPRYREGEEEDTFMFSGAEDLVSYLEEQEGGSRIPTVFSHGDYIIKRYRPRVEGGFARIEKISHPTRGVYWRVTTRDNITTFFGRSPECRIADPGDDARIFEWLPEFSFDHKGSWIRYIYKEENLDGVTRALHEENRFQENLRFTNKYLKSVMYGNRITYLLNDEANPYDPPLPVGSPYFFELVFDYGEHDPLTPLPVPPRESQWPARSDAYSSNRSGFEIRTYRLCQRVLMFHHFPEEDAFGNNYLVRSLNFNYVPSSINDSGQAEVTYLQSITQSGNIRREDGSYSSKSLPPLEFSYQHLDWNTEVKLVDNENIIHAPVGLTNNYQWVDLYGEGISGILTEQATGWFYKSNLGDTDEDGLLSFTQAQAVMPKPSFTGLTSGVLSLQDLEANGEKQVVINSNGLHGYFELTADNDWQSFTAFSDIPNLDLRDPNTRLIDLNGDGQPELVITEENVFVWYAANGKKGYKEAERSPKTFDEEQGPAIVFSDQEQRIFLADMSGDGMTDIVRIRNGEICYWANKGYGRFSAKVNMSNAPLFDLPEAFNPRHLHLADVSGTGATDLIYTGQNKFKAYINLSGNGWSDAHEIDPFFSLDSNAQISVIDLLGTGTSCIVWSSDLPAEGGAPMRYMDLMSSKKPHVLISYLNNLGKETTLHYKSSTYYYLKDKLEGKPWITKLPFPVQVISQVTVSDKWRKTQFSNSYSYHHGYYDHAEREFRGFGRVEQLDVEDFGTFASGNSESPYITQDLTLYQPPIKTITWIHTGAFLSREKILNQFQEEYFSPNSSEFQEKVLLEPDLDSQNLTHAEWQEALRACKGMTLRQEVYELDVDSLHQNKLHIPIKLYHTAYHNCHIQMLQPKQENRHAVFLVTESEAVTYQYELDLLHLPLQPDPRIAHTLNLETDLWGNVLEAVAVVYPRIQAFVDETLPPGAEELINQVQQERHLSFTHNKFTNDVVDNFHYRLRMPCEVATYELTGILPEQGFYFTLEELRGAQIRNNAHSLTYHQLPTTGLQKRLVEQLRILYFNEELSASLPLGQLNWLGLAYETYKLALTEELLAAIFADKLTADIRTRLDDSVVSGYLSGMALRDSFPEEDTEGQYWIRSGIAGFNRGADNHFYLPERYTDAFGNSTHLEYDDLDLYIKSSTDPVANVTEVVRFDYRVLAPLEMRDINGNYSEVKYDTLGLPAAMALKGKGNEADNLDNVESDIEQETLISFFRDSYDTAVAARLLGNATARHLYYMGEVEILAPGGGGSIRYGEHPACAAGIVREKHVAMLSAGETSPIQVGFEYSDGMGQVLVKKVQAEPAREGGPLRWISSGKTIFNNKGKPVKQYEPYFSENEAGAPDHTFKDPDESGVTAVLYYDAAGRQVRTELPDGTYTRVTFSPWQQASYDANDTIQEAGNAWYDRHNATEAPAQHRKAASLAAVHADTPALSFLDSLGREVITVAHNKLRARNNALFEEKYLTYLKMDAEGKPLWIVDARGNRVMQYIFPYKPDNEEEWEGLYVPCFDISGNLLFQHSMDGEDRWMLPDATGQPICSWDSRNAIQYMHYDALRRPLAVELQNDTHASPIVVSLIQYGDKEDWMSVEESQRLNVRGKPYKAYDQSGLVVSKAIDFKGNALEVLKRIALSYEEDTDWATAVNLPHDEEADALLMPESERENNTFTLITKYDALNRMSRLFNWHQINVTGEGGNRVAVYLPRYNARGLLEGEDLVVNAQKTDGGEGYRGGESTHAIRRIDYNEKSQKTRVQYGNQEPETILTTTDYTYDRTTFRLTRLQTTRNRDSAIMQDLLYYYDPTGNITAIENEAEDTLYYRNRRVEPNCLYEYDALYRLIYAEGREHLGQNATPTSPDAYNRYHMIHAHPGDGNAMGTYRERYVYDSVGNILHINHHNTVDPGSAWNRYYQYSTHSNRMLATGVTGAAPGEFYTNAPSLPERYDYNSHGSIVRMPHLPVMTWDFTEHLKHMAITGHPDIPPSLEAWYFYDAQKQRSRKRVRKQGGILEERIYFGGLEWYRRWERGEKVEEIETVHLFEGEQRVLIVDNVLQTDITAPGTGILYRYQFSNHLGSVALELNEEAAIISYEEYHPYGTTAYHATDTEVRATAKRYRYTGMERDEESGLSYHMARYYLPWLGRWCSVDPVGIKNNINLYNYCLSNPIKNIDLNGKQEVPFEASTPGPWSYAYITQQGHQYRVEAQSGQSERQETRGAATEGLVESHVERVEAGFSRMRDEMGSVEVLGFNVSYNPLYWMAYTLSYPGAMIAARAADRSESIRTSFVHDTPFEVPAQVVSLVLIPFEVFHTRLSQGRDLQRRLPGLADTLTTLSIWGDDEFVLDLHEGTDYDLDPDEGTTQLTRTRESGLARAGRVRDLADAEVGAFIEVEGGAISEGTSSTATFSRPEGLSAHYRHAEIDALQNLIVSNGGALVGRRATMSVTEHPCAGACLTTNFRGNIVRLFERSGLSQLTIHSPEAEIVLEMSQSGPVVSRYRVH